jgi:hypothetical protein
LRYETVPRFLSFNGQQPALARLVTLSNPALNSSEPLSNP